ncbi:hypothetical protein MVEN_00634000 [Mycena venus]|uniref:Uncharacterized protein n=1 Tax=Mycena venus TaxID=2733690 RepID=A0A8H6YQ71_9AGAR|nr:hypothetical protein MVEN_00634000 [Mycena venus]
MSFDPQRRTPPRGTPGYAAPQPVRPANLASEVSGQQSFSSYESGQRSTFGSYRTENGAFGGRGGGGSGDDGSGGDGPGGGRGDLVPSGGGGPGGGDPADLIEFLTSRWLKLTVVAQPDLRGLLTHPVLRNIIAAIARDALTEVMNQMREAMESQVYKQMDLHLKPLAKKSAAYSLSELTTMSPAQITDYNTFAPSIRAPPIRGGDDDDERGPEEQP